MEADAVVANAPRAGSDATAPGPVPRRCRDLAIVLDGGGARAAYQVGLLRALGRHCPSLQIPIITGVSAGALNAVFLAGHPGTLLAASDDLSRLWRELTIDRVFRVDARSLVGNVAHWGMRLVAGGMALRSPDRGMVDTSPLRATLQSALETDPGGEITAIARNIEAGRLDALAIITSCYTTGRSVAWVQGRRRFEDWERTFRESRRTRITIDHVMASAALPLLFPARQIDGAWYGDGGIQLTAPLSPALHLGAKRIIAISTRYRKGLPGAEPQQGRPYPPPLQIAGQLLNAVFIDDHDRDALALSRINWLARELPAERRHGLRVVDLVLIRPSVDIGRLAGEFESRLPAMFRHFIGGLGARETPSPDLLSLLMFDPGYLARLIEIGEADAEQRFGEISELLEEID